LNISSKNTINVIALEQKETLSFRVDIQAIEVKSRNPAVFWSIIALTAALLIGGGFFGFRYRKNIVGLFSKKAKVEEVKNKIRQMEEKGTNMAIVNMARLLRFQGKTDEDLKKKLFEEGFNEDEINTAMSTLGGNSEETEEEV